MPAVAVDSRFARAVRRLLNLHGETPADSTLITTHDLGSRAAEYSFARDERRLSVKAFTVAAGGAATFATAQFRNLDESRRAFVAEYIGCRKASAGDVVWWTGQRVIAGWAGATAALVIPHDTRNSGVPGTITPLNAPYEWQNATPAVVLANFAQTFTFSGAGWQWWPVNAVVAPGGGLEVQTQTANEALTVQVVGYDFELHGGEAS